MLDENLADTNTNPKTKGAYPISTLTWILAYKSGNSKNTQDLKEIFYKLLSEEYQSKVSQLGFIPLKGQILEKAIQAVGSIGS